MVPTKSRVRRRFFNQIEKSVKDYEENRLEICRKFCEKEKGNPVFDEMGNFSIPVENRKKYFEEMKKFMDETFFIETPVHMKEDIRILKSMIENSNVEMDDIEYKNYIEVLKSFEEVLLPEKKEESKKEKGKNKK